MLVFIIKQYATNHVCDSCLVAVLQIWTSKLHLLWAKEVSSKWIIGMFPHQLRSPTQLLLKTRPTMSPASFQQAWRELAHVCTNHPGCQTVGSHFQATWNCTWCVQTIGSHSAGNQLLAMVAVRHGGQFVKDVLDMCQLCALLGTAWHAAKWRRVILAQYSKGCQSSQKCQT